MNVPIELLRKEGSTQFPEKGAWVRVCGNRWASRGNRLPRVLETELGIEHGDIVWVANEECRWPWHDAYRESADRGQLGAQVRFLEGILDDQLTWVEVLHPGPNLYRLWSGECTLFDLETIFDLLMNDCLEVVQWSTILSLSDELQVVADAMMVDGATREYAIASMLLGNEGDDFVPTFFFKSAGEYRQQFCEVDDE